MSEKQPRFINPGETPVYIYSKMRQGVTVFPYKYRSKYEREVNGETAFLVVEGAHYARFSGEGPNRMLAPFPDAPPALVANAASVASPARVVGQQPSPVAGAGGPGGGAPDILDADDDDLDGVEYPPTVATPAIETSDSGSDGDENDDKTEVRVPPAPRRKRKR